MEQIINQLLTVGEGLALLWFTWFIWFVSGVANNLFSSNKWSWKRMGEDVLKTFLMVFAALAWVVAFNLLDRYTSNLGIDISGLLDGVSVTGLVAIICGGSGIYLYKGFRNIIKFFIKDHTDLEQIQEVVKISGEITDEKYEKTAEPAKQIINGVYQYLTQPKESIEQHKEWEEKGGLGAGYVVNISTYDAFRAEVIDKGFNIDGAYGAQCWDGAGLLYQQVSMWLQTGNGCAYGCWTLKKDANLGSRFIAITDQYKVRRGDLVVFRAGEYGHIGFADQDYHGGGYIKLLGQNQGGKPYPGGGSNFNVINMSMATFLGAFRLKEWDKKEEQKEEAKPAPAPVPTKEVTFKKGDRVKLKELVDIHGTRLMDLGPDYLIIDNNTKSKIALLQSNDGDIYAWVSYSNMIKV